MIVTYKDVQCVTFPVFKITGSNWTYSDGLLFLENQLLDDKNMSGETLGIRRVQTPFENLYPLRNALINHIGIIKQTTKTFIDSRGEPFIYDKTLMCKLKYYKIRKVDKKGVASILWVKGINFPFTINSSSVGAWDRLESKKAAAIVLLFFISLNICGGSFLNS